MVESSRSSGDHNGLYGVALDGVLGVDGRVLGQHGRGSGQMVLLVHLFGVYGLVLSHQDDVDGPGVGSGIGGTDRRTTQTQQAVDVQSMPDLQTTPFPSLSYLQSLRQQNGSPLSLDE